MKRTLNIKNKNPLGKDFNKDFSWGLPTVKKGRTSAKKHKILRRVRKIKWVSARKQKSEMIKES